MQSIDRLNEIKFSTNNSKPKKYLKFFFLKKFKIKKKSLKNIFEINSKESNPY